MKTENLTREALKKYAAENREAFEALLKDFVEIPSISVDPTKKDAIRENAKLAADVIRRFGGEAKILETDGHGLITRVLLDRQGERLYERVTVVDEHGRRAWTNPL